MGELVLIGWTFDIELLKRILPGFVAMNPLTAIGFILTGSALGIFCKDQLIAVVSHDLSSPLTGLRMVIDLLREAEGRAPAELLNMMDHCVRRMVSMVRGLLDAHQRKVAPRGDPRIRRPCG